MNTSLRNVLLVVSFGSAVALAAGKSYMTLVGELVGAVESPRVIRDFCATHSPANAEQNANLYKAWQERHKDLLNAVAEQITRASVRLRKQGAPGGDEPVEMVREAIARQLENALGGMITAESIQYCSQYPRFIEKKDEEARTAIPKLLAEVEYADKDLTARERTNTSLEHARER